MSEHAEQEVRAPRLRITVIRADGTVEDHGTVEAVMHPVEEPRHSDNEESE